MSRGNSYAPHVLRPPVVTGEDGLPHCGWCLSDAEDLLCDYHRREVRTAIASLASASLLARANSDLRYIVHQRLDREADA